MVLLTRFDLAFAIVMILTNSCWKANAVSLSFGDRCRMSTHFAQLYGTLCDPYLTPVDCQVRAWGPWDSSGSCNQTRTRTVQTLARNGGQPCPSLQEGKTVPCFSNTESTAQQVLGILKKGLGGFGSYSPVATTTVAGGVDLKYLIAVDISADIILDQGSGLLHGTDILYTPVLEGEHTTTGVDTPVTTADAIAPLSKPANITTISHGISRHVPKSCPADRDIVVIVDTSSSVGSTHFHSALNDLSELIPLLCGYQPGIISRCRAYRLAMITYGSFPRLAFDLDDLANRHIKQLYVKEDIKTRPSYIGGHTVTGDALKFAADRVLQISHGMRPRSKKTILLLTDGRYNRGVDPVTISKQLFQRYHNQLSIVALGIGRRIDYNELKAITKHYNPANPLVFMMESFKSFHDMVEQIKQLLSHGQNKCNADVLVKKRKK